MDTTKLEIQIESLQQEVNKLENIIDKKVSKDDADYIKLKNDLDETKQKVAKLEENLLAIRESQKRSENKLNDVDSSVNANNVTLAKLSTVLDSLNTNIQNLNKKVGELDKDNILNTNQRKLLGWTGKQIAAIIIGLVVTAVITYIASQNVMQKQLNNSLTSAIQEQKK